MEIKVFFFFIFLTVLKSVVTRIINENNKSTLPIVIPPQMFEEVEQEVEVEEEIDIDEEEAKKIKGFKAKVILLQFKINLLGTFYSICIAR